MKFQTIFSENFQLKINFHCQSLWLNKQKTTSINVTKKLVQQRSDAVENSSQNTWMFFSWCSFKWSSQSYDYAKENIKIKTFVRICLCLSIFSIRVRVSEYFKRNEGILSVNGEKIVLTLLCCLRYSLYYAIQLNHFVVCFILEIIKFLESDLRIKQIDTNIMYMKPYLRVHIRNNIVRNKKERNNA